MMQVHNIQTLGNCRATGGLFRLKMDEPPRQFDGVADQPSCSASYRNAWMFSTLSPRAWVTNSVGRYSQ
jgi:hypothetical protein